MRRHKESSLFSCFDVKREAGYGFPGMAWKGLCDKGYETVTGQAGLGSKAAVLRTNSERPVMSARAPAPLPLLSPNQHLCLKGACD